MQCTTVPQLKNPGRKTGLGEAVLHNKPTKTLCYHCDFSRVPSAAHSPGAVPPQRAGKNGGNRGWGGSRHGPPAPRTPAVEHPSPEQEVEQGLAGSRCRGELAKSLQLLMGSLSSAAAGHSSRERSRSRQPPRCCWARGKLGIA